MQLEKPKRKGRPQQKSLIRSVLIVIMLLPLALVVLHPRIGQSLFADGIALSVLICAAVYLVHQAFVYLIASYLGLIHEPSDTSLE